ncbi:glycine oxidase ThiO [Paenibacillus soyae]|uniref:glycine oxidase n=1 Tax=Paenibacillus soyae TaxID=2969249 RepID=A0A9X2S807_9BACL|nr:glycine oxidase ThiO [Paenibacillus soyae]MCR2803869.1 glycine oxidase ThiO [Paenibacillus soyae]
MSEHIIIMGGGVIGLSVAFELQSRGYQTTVLEMARCGGQASGAAAGMLAPYSENVEGPDPFFQLCLDSLRLYPDWIGRVRERSDVTFEYSESGSLYLSYHEADRLALEGRLLWQREHGSTGAIIDGPDLFDMEPLLSRQVKAALYTPEESHLYAPDYVRALEDACRSTGGAIHEQLGRVSVLEWRNGIVLEAQDGRRFSGDRLVVCSGAWAQELAETFDLPLPIYPIRGQICAYALDDVAGDVDGKAVRHMLFGNQGYLVAKANGTLVCGASEDVAGFDTSVTERGIERLRGWNKQAIPALENCAPFHQWAGLRPSTQDGYPFLGGLDPAAQVMFAAGHYRNGILLSPITAKLVADRIENKALPSYYSYFAPGRFDMS